MSLFDPLELGAPSRGVGPISLDLVDDIGPEWTGGRWNRKLQGPRSIQSASNHHVLLRQWMTAYTLLAEPCPYE